MADAVAETLGAPPPSTPCTSARTGALTLLWLGPDECLVTMPAGEEQALGESLRQHLVGGHASVVDVTDGRTVIRVSGPRAPNLLAKGCTLDFHPRGFAAGLVKQSRLAQIDVILHKIEDREIAGGPVFDIYVARSYAAFLWDWLREAGREYGLAVSTAP